MSYRVLRAWYSKDRSTCRIEIAVTRPSGWLRRKLGLGPTTEVVEVETFHYGKRWFTGLLRDPSPELTALAKATYSWLPTPQEGRAA